MSCDFEYCIYNKDYLCTLEEVRINSLGMCEDSITVSMPANILKELKEIQRMDIKNR